jgi:hypothetical protein
VGSLSATIVRARRRLSCTLFVYLADCVDADFRRSGRKQRMSIGQMASSFWRKINSAWRNAGAGVARRGTVFRNSCWFCYSAVLISM